MRPIGYYVHHQGIGHWQRATALARHLRRPCTLLGTFALGPAEGRGLEFVELPDDAPRSEADRACAVPGLHYAPLGHDGLRQRMARIAAWIAEARPALLIVDVSVEVALLVRLCSTPFLYFRLAGRRDDTPHLAAFEAADALVAPFPELLDAETGWVREKTFFAGFLAEPHAVEPTLDGGITVLFGRGGAGGDFSALVAMARAVPERRCRVLGPVSAGEGDLPPNLELLGWREDAMSVLADAELVVGGAGDGVLAEVAALGKRFLCLPEDRPFGEQRAKAVRLEALGARRGAAGLAGGGRMARPAGRGSRTGPVAHRRPPRSRRAVPDGRLPRRCGGSP
jgi:UDP-N-acetylglucosamine--N-acetylmuramyl-(pentapeptide) pyrophosphoryl-undecaprenol N-acetylglucosamine transferase